MVTKPTLLVLASTFPRWKNDTEPRFVYDLCTRLKPDFKIIVLAPHSINSELKENLDGLEVIRYRYAPQKFETLAYEGGISTKLKGNKLNWLILPFFFLGQWIAILKLLRSYPIKVIHAHWLIPQAILALLARLVSKNKPSILCTSHGGDLYGLNDSLSQLIKRCVIKNVDGLTVVSRAMQEEVLKIFPQAKLPLVAPMGTDLQNMFFPDSSVARDPNQLLFVGRLVEKKGLTYLIDALSGVLVKNPNVILNIAGSGPEKIKLQEQVKKLELNEHVFFLGRLSHDELVDQYRKSSIAVFPFIQAKNGDLEGLGLVMVEAMGCGCPVITTSIPAVKDVVTDGQTGLIVEAESKSEIEQKINKLLSSKELQNALSKKGREYVLGKFSWDVTSHRYTSILKTLIQKFK